MENFYRNIKHLYGNKMMLCFNKNMQNCFKHLGIIKITTLKIMLYIIDVPIFSNS